MTDELGFAASVIKSIAWPVTVLVAVATFRSPLATLISNIKQVSGKGVVVDFRAKMADLEETLPAGAQAAPGAAAAASEELNQSVPPADVINNAWNRLERALQDVSDRRSLGDGRGRFRNAELIADRVGIASETVGQIRQLRGLWRSALREPEAFAAADALRFANAAAEVMAKVPAS